MGLNKLEENAGLGNIKKFWIFLTMCINIIRTILTLNTDDIPEPH